MNDTHSNLGASGAKRWMNCPGSTTLIKALGQTGDREDEPGFRTDGSIAHAGAAVCLETGADAWELIGDTYEVEGQHRPFTGALVEAVQVYVAFCRCITGPGDQVFVEHRFECLELHPDFRGTTDYGVANHNTKTLRIVDYKNGAGILVEAGDNPQAKYYARGLLQHPDLADMEFVEWTIVQPNIPWAPGGPIRSAACSVQELFRWADETLLPAMRSTDKTLTMGDWCRFCPAMLTCPATSSTYRAMATAGENPVHMSTQALDLEYSMIEAVQMRMKKLRDEAFRRALTGHAEFQSFKLVQQRSDRVFKDGAEARFRAELGDKAFSSPKLLTPAAMEKVSATAKTLVKAWSHTPDTGFTLAPRSDKRVEVKPQPASAIFAKALLSLDE